MKSLATQLRQAGEVYAAALLEHPERTPLWRYSRATADFFKGASLPHYDGGRLYPCGPSFSASTPLAVKPEFSFIWSLETEKLRLTRLLQNPPVAAPTCACKNLHGSVDAATGGVCMFFGCRGGFRARQAARLRF